MSVERFISAGNQDIPNLSVADLAREHNNIRDRFNAFVAFRSGLYGDPTTVATEPSQAEQNRAHELWKELLRRAIVGDTEATQTIVDSDLNEDLVELDGSVSKETLKRLLDSSDTLADG